MDALLQPLLLALSRWLDPPLALWPVQALSTASEPAQPPEPVTDTLDSPRLLVYTSGTTGPPKGAVHTQGNVLAKMAIAAQVQGMSAADTVLTVLPLFHVGGLGKVQKTVLQAVLAASGG